MQYVFINDLVGSISVQGLVLRTTGNRDAFKFNNCKELQYKVVSDKAKKELAQMLRMFRGARTRSRVLEAGGQVKRGGRIKMITKKRVLCRNLDLRKHWMSER